MSTERKRTRDIEYEQLGDAEIAGFLHSHPDFFERHPGLLAHLRLPHDPGDNTVSLIERQVAILREKNRKLDHKLRELVAVARANDVLSGKIHGLAMRLMGTTDLATMLATVEKVLHDELGSDRSVLVLFGDEPPEDEQGDLLETGFVRNMSREDPGLDLFQTFVNTGRPRCGEIKGVKREFLFGNDGADIQSAALIPLGEKARLGFLAIGSHESSRFHPGMSTDFLARLGELVERGLDCAD